MSSQVEAQLYDYSYLTDIVHGYRTQIKEVFIPTLNICFNVTDNQLNVFKQDKPRNFHAQVRHEWTEETLERAKSEPKLAKLIAETKDEEVPEESTGITVIQLDKAFVDQLVEIIKMNKYKDQVQKLAARYIKN